MLLGANADDLGVFRPGLHAAQEWGSSRPGGSWADKKKCARYPAHSTWELEFSASPCLAHAYHTARPYPRKAGANRRREAYLRALNFAVVRVRNQDLLARIEVDPQEIPRLIGLRDTITAYFKQIGFRYITVDLEGFRSGSLNEVLQQTASIS